MDKNSKRLLYVVLLIGWAFDFLFWGKSVGINFAIFATLCLLGVFYLLSAEGQRPSRTSLWLLAPFAFFAVISFMRLEPLTRFLAYTFTIFSLGLLATCYQNGRWVEYSLLDYFSRFFILGISMIALPMDLLIMKIRRRDEVVQEQSERAEGPTVSNEDQASNNPMTDKSKIWAVFRGLLLAIPLVIFFAYLLAAADPIFSQKLGDFIGLFDSGKIIEYIIRLFVILFHACLLAGVYLHTKSLDPEDKLLGEDEPIVKQSLGFTEAAIVLASVAVLFTLFVLVQFRYFFGGEANIGVTGYTYSQYARRGFNELVLVALFSLLLTLGLSTVTRREAAFQRRVFSGLCVTIAVLVLVILVSAYQRLTLAILWHGYSRLRLYPRAFMIWLGILFVAVVVLELMQRERNFGLAAVLASLGFAATLSLINVDASIVRHNVYRAELGLHFNVTHLAMLSNDAVPALADEFLDPTLSDETRQGVGAALACHLHTVSDMSPEAWPSNTLSQWRAENALMKIQSRLDGYHINDRKSPVRVRTPNGKLYLCWE